MAGKRAAARGDTASAVRTVIGGPIQYTALAGKDSGLVGVDV